MKNLLSKEASKQVSEFEGHESSITGIERRSMLKLMGASAALAGAGVSCRRPVENIMPYSKQPEEVVPGIPNYFATAMPSNQGAIGMVVESHEGRPTKVEGNKEHPGSLGAMTSSGQAAVLGLYDPNRSKSVLKRELNMLMPANWSDWDSEFQKILDEGRRKSGSGLGLWVGDTSSPSLNRAINHLKVSFPKLRTYGYDALENVNQGEALKQIFSKNKNLRKYKMRPEYDLSKAKIIFSLQSDFLGVDSNSLNYSKQFAANRKIYSPKDVSKMSRLYVAESAYSITGANSDNRDQVSQSRAGEYLENLLNIFKDNLKSNNKFLVALSKDLRANRGKSVVLVGDAQPAWVHALGFELNQILGNFGKTVSFRKERSNGLTALNSLSLRDFVRDAEGNELDDFLILDSNPVYATPKGFGFEKALSKVKNKVHVGLYEDETAKKCDWHLPLSHFLESWGDTRAVNGTASIVQPLIAPLHKTRSALEILVGRRKGLDFVKNTWAASLSAENFKKALRDGIVANSAFSVLNLANLNLDFKLKRFENNKKNNLELTFVPDAYLQDGRFANCSWLQELPDSMTKLVWGNALIVGPGFAKKYKINSRVDKRVYLADVVKLSTNHNNKNFSLETPVFVLPGVADDTASLAMGYGRHAAGAVGDHVGVNAFELMPGVGDKYLANIKVEHLHKTASLASTQEAFAMNSEQIREETVLSLHGRNPTRDENVEAFKKEPNYVENYAIPASMTKIDKKTGKREPVQLTKPWPYTGNKWGMTIDLSSCTGCNACVVACQAENNIPVVGAEQVKRGRLMHWLRVDRYYTGDVTQPESVQQPVPCMQCENAPCEPVCPVAATAHDKEGLNTMAYNRCVGTRYCANNCPVKVRHFNYFDFTHSGNIYVDSKHLERQQTLEMQKNPNVTIRYRGTMEKCTYCTQRIQAAKAEARRDGRDPNALRDGDVMPACAQTCATGAIKFGNLNEENSEVNQLKNTDRNYTLLSELNIRPRTSYLSKLRNPNPELVS